MSDLSNRLAALRESSNTSITSEIKTPTPFITFLLAYLKSRDESYKEYMLGAKLLYKYLAPIDIPKISVMPTPIYSNIFHKYEIQELAKILCEFNLLGKTDSECAIQLTEVNYIINLIMYTSCKIILGETNV